MCTPVLLVVPPLQESDVYAFAIIGWILVSHGDTFLARNLGQHYIATVELSERPTFPATTITEFAALIQSCWLAIPSQRPTFRHILSALEVMYTDVSQ